MPLADEPRGYCGKYCRLNLRAPGPHEAYCITFWGFVSALVFAGASTLYMHGYVSKAARIRGEEMGAWSFVAGSVGFMLASFVNALGLAAALQLADAARVTVLSKGDIPTGTSHWAQGGVAAVMDPEDSYAAHVTDTVEAGAGLCDAHDVAARHEGWNRFGLNRRRGLVTFGIQSFQNSFIKFQIAEG